MSTYNAKVHVDQGAERLSIESGGEINIETGGKILANGTQASNIAAPTGGATVDAEARTAITAILAALDGVGITA